LHGDPGHMIARFLTPLLLASTMFIVAACGSSSNGTVAPPPPPAGLSAGPNSCIGGMAGDFACSGLSLRKRVPTDALGGGDGNDIWGWADAITGNEYALVGLSTGTAFVDVTDSESPVFLGHLATNTVESPWRDIKVYSDYAFIVADAAGAHGMQVFDLARLRGIASPQTFIADAVYSDFHGIGCKVSQEDGTFRVRHVDKCCPGAQPPGCLEDADTHDTQCVVYQGPDTDYTGQEVCFSSNGSQTRQVDNHLGIANVTDKTAPLTISSTSYPDAGFAHQGWLTDDHRYFLLGDELDERNLGVPTRTLIFDIADLDAPIFVSAHESTTTSIDHNLYVLGNRIFQGNYTSGLRVLEFANLSNSEVTEVAFLDTFPSSDGPQFDGVWSVYPYLPSGNIIVSDISNGLFILTLQ